MHERPSSYQLFKKQTEVKVYVEKESKQAGDTDGLRSCALGSQFIHYNKVVPGCQEITIDASRT